GSGGDVTITSKNPTRLPVNKVSDNNFEIDLNLTGMATKEDLEGLTSNGIERAVSTDSELIGVKVEEKVLTVEPKLDEFVRRSEILIQDVGYQRHNTTSILQLKQVNNNYVYFLNDNRGSATAGLTFR